MTTQELKPNIHGLVNQTEDPDVLQSIYLLLNKLVAAHADDDVFGFEADGTPITVEDFIRTVQESDEDISAGYGIPHETMKASYGA
ncbi:MAG: hypothetical protein H7246_07370 [Phycisphaerae bacterium]|nr:hypothetical protein [Saprospiraceae bacterium]